MQREEPDSLLRAGKKIRFNAGGTADFILIISVPGYLSIPGLFVFPGMQHLKYHKGIPDAVRNTAYQGKEKEKWNW